MKNSSIEFLISYHRCGGFKKCGIYPYDKEKLLSNLPDKTTREKDKVPELLINFLSEKRFNHDENNNHITKSKGA